MKIRMRNLIALGLRWLRSLSVLILLPLVEPTCAGSDEATYWADVIQRYGRRVEDTPDPAERTEKWRAVRANARQRVRDNASLAWEVRRTMRSDDRAWVRALSASVLIDAFKEELKPEDYTVILSDPSLEVRGLGLLAVDVYGVEQAACYLGASLLRKEPHERLSAVRRMRKLLRGNGLPYYSALLDDPDNSVASEAAKGYATCKKENAIPHLLRYLREHGDSAERQVVTDEVIDTLRSLYDEAGGGVNAHANAVAMWKQRLGKEIEKERVRTNGPPKSNPVPAILLEDDQSPTK